jgi:hypothetical protein
MVANLRVLTGDVMSWCHCLSDSLKAIQAAPDLLKVDDQFVRRAMLYLQFLRQTDRLAQVERRLAEDSGAARGR